MAKEEIQEILKAVDTDPYQIEPYHDYVVLVYDEERMMQLVRPPGSSLAMPVSAGGIIQAGMGSGAVDKTGEPVMKLAYCHVVKVGPGRWREGHFVETRTKPGDMVAFCPRYATHEFMYRGRQYACVPEQDIVMRFPYAKEKDRGAA